MTNEAKLEAVTLAGYNAYFDEKYRKLPKMGHNALMVWRSAARVVISGGTPDQAYGAKCGFNVPVTPKAGAADWKAAYAAMVAKAR